MSGYDLRKLMNSKCPLCSYYLSCKIQDGFKALSNNSNINQKDYDKLNNCLFFNQLK